MPKPAFKFRVIVTLLFLSFFLVTLLISPRDSVFSSHGGSNPHSNHHNGNCSFTVNPDPIYVDSTLNIRVSSPNDLELHEHYNLTFTNQNITQADKNIIDPLTMDDGTISGTTLRFAVDLTEVEDQNNLLFGELIIRIRSAHGGMQPCKDSNGDEEHRVVIAGSSTVPPGVCTIEIDPISGITPSTEISFRVRGFEGTTPARYLVKVRKEPGEGDWYESETFIETDGNSQGFASITIPEEGFDYQAVLYNGNIIATPACVSLTFSVTELSNFVPPDTSADTTGALPDNVKKVVNFLLTFGIGVAGGVAFLMLVYGSIKLIFSSGDPKAVGEGREVITSAVVGLIVVVFSVFILRLIGISILGLPI